MRKFSTLLLLFLAFNTYAQTGFQLQDLELPDVQRHVFRFNLGAGNSSNTNSQNSGRSNLNANFIFNPTYSGYKNFRYRQSFTNASMNLTPGMKRKVEKLGPDSNGLFQELSLQSNINYRTDQYYYNKNYWFVGYQASANVTFNGLKNKNNSDIIEENSKYYLKGSLGIHFGKGRLDPIDQGHTAFFMMRDLQRDISFNRAPVVEEYVELANLIATLRQVRNFDSRYRRIDQLEQLDSFFTSKGLVTECSPTFYTRVLDNFLYPSLFNRTNGKRWIFSINPSYERDFSFKRVFQTLGNETIITPGIYTSVKRELYKQRSNTIQDYHAYGLSYSASTGYGRTWNSLEGRAEQVEVETSTAQLFVDRVIRFFPSTRTNFYINGHASISTNLISSTSLPSTLNLYAYTGGYYYISPATRLSGNFGLGARQEILFNARNQSPGLQYSFNISLLHNVF